jgi:NADH-quinone oxidoreductase subunit L
MYTFRLVFIAFFGEAKQQIWRRPGPLMQVPLLVLAVLSLSAGWLNLPRTLGNVPLLFDFLHTALPATETATGVGVEAVLQAIAAAVSLGGIYLAYIAFYRYPAFLDRLAISPAGGALHRLWFTDWGLDWLYGTLLVRPYAWVARVDRRDVIDVPFRAAAWISRGCGYGLSRTQTGHLRWYAAAVAVGAIVAIGVLVVL